MVCKQTYKSTISASSAMKKVYPGYYGSIGEEQKLEQLHLIE